MKESYRKDDTHHPDPESCGVGREAGHEALTGAGAGEPLSREIRKTGLPTPLTEAEGNTIAGGQVDLWWSPRGRRTSARTETSGTGTGRSTACPSKGCSEDRPVKADGLEAGMNEPRKSDGSVVSKKLANDVLPLWAWAQERAERRDPAKENTPQQNTPQTQSWTYGVPSALERVRQAARKDRKTQFTALLHHVTVPKLKAAFEGLERKAAAGVDGVNWQEYRNDLDVRLHELHERVQGGRYRPQASRRVYIPKADGRQRPLGIAALEDKIVQGAVVEVLNAIFEEDFLGFSYGFRPGRSPHQALDALAFALQCRKVNWVLDADIRGYFDNIRHEWLVKFLQHRIADRRLVRLIQKWLKAGVLEHGEWKPTEEGTPQGATISPLLANLYLHHVLDLWAHHWRKHHALGQVAIVRYADDFVMGFEKKDEAEHFLKELRHRMQKFGLELHPEKTRLIEFGRFAAMRRASRGEGKPETFSFLGFTHYCGRSRNGKFMVHRCTMAKRQRAKLREIANELRRRRCQPIPEQGAWLQALTRGYYAYHAVPGNIRVLDQFRTQVADRWLAALRRRGQKRRINWSRMGVLVNRWLPHPRICHPWPWTRFDARIQGKSRVR